MTKKIGALALALACFGAPKAHAAVCTETGFIRDDIDLTAALINPVTVTSPVNATGCDIGVYYDNAMPGGVVTLNKAEVSGAKYFGVMVNGDSGPLAIHITETRIHDVGNTPYDDAAHGVGIYLRAFSTFDVTGEVVGNIVFAYQKGGIVANGRGVKLSRLDNNQVHGLGHVDFIAQNGIQVGYGALPYPSQVVGNTVTGNSYIGLPGDGTASAGILVVGGPGYTCPDSTPCPFTKVVLIGVVTALNAIIPNMLLNNDVGVFVNNLAADGVSPPPTPTNVLVLGNVAGGDIAYNTVYLAGVSDFGHTDYLLGNNILQGGPYGSPCSSNIDTAGSITPQVFHNTPASCVGGARASARAARVVPEKP